VLSLEETGRLENYGVWPVCRNHRHVPKRDAVKAVEAEEFRFVGGPDTAVAFVSAIVPVNTSGMWVPVQCHDYDGRKIQGFRTWGIAPTG
jgi:hypothetical protein